MPQFLPASPTLVSTVYIARDLNISRATVYNLAATDPTFPRPIFLGTHRKYVLKDYEIFRRKFLAEQLGRPKRGRPPIKKQAAEAAEAAE